MLRRRQRRDLRGRAGADLAGVALHVDDALGVLGKGQVLRGQRLHASSAMKPMGKSVKKTEVLHGFTMKLEEIRDFGQQNMTFSIIFRRFLGVFRQLQAPKGQCVTGTGDSRSCR